MGSGKRGERRSMMDAGFTDQYRVSSDREELPTVQDTAPGCAVADDPGCRAHDSEAT